LKPFLAHPHQPVAMKPFAAFSIMLGAAEFVLAAPFQSPPPIIPSGVQNLPQPGSGITLRSTTRLVDVTAVVEDKNGKPVVSLKREDFEIYHEGKRQNIRLFSEPVLNSPASAEARTRSASSVSPPRQLFSNQIEPSSGLASPTVILIDEGAGTSGERLFARGRILQFLSQAQPGQPIGLYIPIEAGVGVVRLTLDSTDLVTAIKAWNEGSQSLQSRVAEPRNLDEKAAASRGACGVANGLTAITASANHIAGISGRKALI
jgi:VWFA-related protein